MRRCMYGVCRDTAKWFGPLQSELDVPDGGTYPTYACDEHAPGMAFIRSIEVFESTGDLSAAQAAAAAAGFIGSSDLEVLWSKEPL